MTKPVNLVIMIMFHVRGFSDCSIQMLSEYYENTRKSSISYADEGVSCSFQIFFNTIETILLLMKVY